jgi:DNA-binding MurR/RpiR family transcriptional regulator
MTANAPSGTSAAGIDRLVDLVREIHLTPTQRTIMRTLVKHADRAAYLTTTEVAELAQVSQPSVTRFAVALGFDGYPKLRKVMQQGQRSAGIERDGPTNEWQRSIDFEMSALSRVRESFAREEEVRAIAERLVQSKPLLVAGHRSGFPVAEYIAYFAGRMLDDVRIVPSSNSAPDLDALVQARAAGADAVLAIVLPRYGEDALRFMRDARRVGFEVICITDSVASPAADLADRVLVAPVDSSLIFDSPAVPMIVANVLLAAMSEVGAASTQARLERFDDIARRDDSVADRNVSRM